MSASAQFKSSYTSPLAGVSDEAWNRFVYAMDVQAMNAVSESGGFGSFDIRPRRLAELGLMTNLRSTRTDGGRQILTGDFVLPLSRERFLSSPVRQYNTFVLSITKYDEDIEAGKLEVPDGIEHSEALVILHVGGRGALAGWPDVFDSTKIRVKRAGRLF